MPPYSQAAPVLSRWPPPGQEQTSPRVGVEPSATEGVEHSPAEGAEQSPMVLAPSSAPREVVIGTVKDDDNSSRTESDKGELSTAGELASPRPPPRQSTEAGEVVGRQHNAASMWAAGDPHQPAVPASLRIPQERGMAKDERSKAAILQGVPRCPPLLAPSRTASLLWPVSVPHHCCGPSQSRLRPPTSAADVLCYLDTIQRYFRDNNIEPPEVAYGNRAFSSAEQVFLPTRLASGTTHGTTGQRMPSGFQRTSQPVAMAVKPTTPKAKQMAKQQPPPQDYSPQLPPYRALAVATGTANAPASLCSLAAAANACQRHAQEMQQHAQQSQLAYSQQQPQGSGYRPMPVAMAQEYPQQPYPEPNGQGPHGSLLWAPVHGLELDPKLEQPWHGEPPHDEEGDDELGEDRAYDDDDEELDFIADYLERDD